MFFGDPPRVLIPPRKFLIFWKQVIYLQLHTDRRAIANNNGYDKNCEKNIHTLANCSDAEVRLFQFTTPLRIRVCKASARIYATDYDHFPSKKALPAARFWLRFINSGRRQIFFFCRRTNLGKTFEGGPPASRLRCCRGGYSHATANRNFDQ